MCVFFPKRKLMISDSLGPTKDRSWKKTQRSEAPVTALRSSVACLQSPHGKNDLLLAAWLWKKKTRVHHFERLGPEYIFPVSDIRYISHLIILASLQGFHGQGCFIRMVLDQRFLFLVAFGDKNSFVLAFTNTTSHWVSQEKFPAFTAQSLPNHK